MKDPNALEIPISGNRKMSVDSIRINGDIYNTQGELLEEGRFVEMEGYSDAAKLIGAQTLANAISKQLEEE